jgi:methyl-accepting chemotaxis protein-2 (aspartate sensor receptor)
MRYQWVLPWLRRSIVPAVAFALCAVVVSIDQPATAQAQPGLEATVFNYDGQDFVRVKTTLRTQDGKSAVNTKLDRDTPAYKALVQKRSYSGAVTVFGRRYDASYAPLTGADGKLTGALFVGVSY